MGPHFLQHYKLPECVFDLLEEHVVGPKVVVDDDVKHPLGPEGFPDSSLPDRLKGCELRNQNVPILVAAVILNRFDQCLKLLN